MKVYRFFFTWLFLMGIHSITSGQGCSDAGFCSLNSFKAKRSDSSVTKYSNHFKAGASFGKADHEINIIGSFIEYHRAVNECSSLDIKLTYLNQKNDLVSSAGFSDLFLNASWLIAKNLYVITGCKVALSNGNADDNGNYLPMDFQHSIGTFDVILGFSYKVGDLQLFFAGQQPLNRSKNKFLAEKYPANSPFREYQSTNNYKRQGDILFRAAYPIAIAKGITVTPSLLPIYHLSDDEFTNAAGDNETILDSKGLTFNANLFVDFNLNEHSTVSLSFAAPLVTREVRPDGLTRKFLAGLDYSFKF